MAEIMDVLDNMIKRELNNASNYVTRSTIKMRVLLKIMQSLDLSLQSIYDTKNLIHVDISCSTAIEKSWMESCGNNVSTDEWAVLERFLAKDFVRNIDLMRLATALTKKVSKKDLYCIFAVDGLTDNDDSLKNYFDNLTIPMEFGERNHEELEEESMKHCHVRAIRTIHKYMTTTDNECPVVVTPEILGNVLKKIFDIDNNPTIIKNDSCKRDDIYSNSDNSSISGESDDDDENNNLERHIGDMYKRLVGVKLYAIASWKKSEYNKRQAILNNSGTLKKKRSRKQPTSKNDDEELPKKLKTENLEENE